MTVAWWEVGHSRAQGNGLQRRWLPCLVALVACGGTNSDTLPSDSIGGTRGGMPGVISGMQVLYTGELAPQSIAVDERYVYWATTEGVRRAPLAGGDAPTTIATRSGVGRVLPSGNYVYFTESVANSGGVGRVAGDGGTPTRLAEVIGAWGIAIADGKLYWAEGGNTLGVGRILRSELDGSDSVELAVGLPSPGDIAIDAEFIYFESTSESCFFDSPSGLSGCEGGGIHRVPRAGGIAERVHATSAFGNMLLNERGLYWPVASPPRVMFAPRGASEQAIASVLREGIGSLSADGAALYWASGDRVVRMPFESAEVVRLITELEGASSVAPSGGWAYVAETAAGRILRVATDGSANLPMGPITGPCPEPIGTAEELALTPRSDVNLEQLALSLDTGRLTASSSTYDRVIADVAAIRALSPELADIGYFAPHDGKELFLSLTDIAAQSLAAGDYSAWDCLNETYGLTGIDANDGAGGAYVLIELQGTYDIPQHAQLYAQLPGVRGAEANGFVGDGSTLCAARDGDRYEYVVDRAGGDCPSGCTEHEGHHFVSDAAGQITAQGVWSLESGEPAPEWFGRICR